MACAPAVAPTPVACRPRTAYAVSLGSAAPNDTRCPPFEVIWWPASRRRTEALVLVGMAVGAADGLAGGQDERDSQGGAGEGDACEASRG